MHPGAAAGKFLRRFTKYGSRELNVFNAVKAEYNGLLPDDTVAARINDDSFILAIFMDGQQLERSIEDFILQLYWKRKIDDQKIFILRVTPHGYIPERRQGCAFPCKAVIRQFETKPEK